MTIGFICVMALVAVACLAVITTSLVIMALLKRFEVTLGVIKDYEHDMLIWLTHYVKETPKKDESPEKSRRRHRGGRKHRKNKKISDDILSAPRTRGYASTMISGTDYYESVASHKKDK